MPGIGVAAIGIQEQRAEQKERLCIQRLNDLERDICLLSDCLAMLEERLQPVLECPPPSDGAMKPDPPTAGWSALANELFRLSNRVTDMTGRVKSMNSRLEI